MVSTPSAWAETGFDPGGAPLTRYIEPGPYPVGQSQPTGPCDDSIYGWFTNHVADGLFLGATRNLTCTSNFPYGLDSNIGVLLYYPQNIADLDPLPAFVFVPGFDANPAVYEPMARQWASYGFVVALPTDGLNMDSPNLNAGAAALANAERDPANILHGKIDLSHTVVGGHSGGASNTLNTAATMVEDWNKIDPRLRNIAAIVDQPPSGYSGAALRVPTLFVTGVEDFGSTCDMVRSYFEQDTNSPAVYACLENVWHGTPMNELDQNPVSGITLAWLQYVANNDSHAAQYFTGADWSLPSDPGIKYVLRNSLADQLPAPTTQGG